PRQVPILDQVADPSRLQERSPVERRHVRVGRSFHRLADRGEAFLEEGRPGCGSRTAGNGDERSRANRNAGGSESVPCGLEGVSVDIEAVVEIAGLTPEEG